MAVIGKLYRANKSYVGGAPRSSIKIEQLPIVLVIDRYSNVAGRPGVRVVYLIGENKNIIEEPVFHQYFDLLEEEV